MRTAFVIVYDADGKPKVTGPVSAGAGKDAYRAAALKPGERAELWNSDAGIVKRRKYHDPEAVAEAGPSFDQGLKQLSAVAKADNSNALPVKKEAAKPAAVIAPAAVEKPESADETPVDAEDIQEESAPVQETPSPETKPKKNRK